MRVNPWMRCSCGKLHVATFVSRTTVCNCGLSLREQFVVRSLNARGNLR